MNMYANLLLLTAAYTPTLIDPLRHTVIGPTSTKAIRTHDLYIHPLYVLVSQILSSILNSPAPIHHLYHHLSILSTVGPTLSLYLNISMCDLVLKDLLR
jgi:hypothetical protein